MVKLCIGCKYLSEARFNDYCRHPASRYDYSIVNGEYRNRPAIFMRGEGCGKEAVLYEAKPIKPWWKLW